MDLAPCPVAQLLLQILTMCHLLSCRRLLPASLVVSFATMACGGSETARPASNLAQGGGTGTTNVQGGGTTAAAETGGATVGGATPVGMGGDYGTASAGTATAGGRRNTNQHRRHQRDYNAAPMRLHSSPTRYQRAVGVSRRPDRADIRVNKLRRRRYASSRRHPSIDQRNHRILSCLHQRIASSSQHSASG